MAFSSIELSTGWEFKQTDDVDESSWLSVARVPTQVHLDLIEHGKIPDPFLGFNELRCEWVAEKSWTYRTKIPKTSVAEHGTKQILAFDGLDTFATVRLNNDIVLTSENMWIPSRVDVTQLLEADTDNVLEVEFASARLRACEIKDAHPEHKWVGFNGDMARLAVRKAQYHWGWDWGPILNTCGPWQPIRLETYTGRISDLRIDYTLDQNLNSAIGTIKAFVEGSSGSIVDLTITLGSTTVFTASTQINIGTSTAEAQFKILDPELWYPHGYGKQPLYDVRAVLYTSSKLQLHATNRRTGLRKAELLQEKDTIGRSFFFRVNHVDMFCGGSDWIPADNFVTRISEERYRAWLQMMVDGNQLMIRIWGGGIYEDPIFYTLCDELGILVWQDFMFGCGNYPAFPSLLESIKTETTSQVKRLRHHPSIVIYAGNNEDYQVQEQFKLTYDYADKNPGNWLATDFPARYIYEKLLPDVVAAESPHVPYHPGSPWGDGLVSSDTTVGDMHQWNVWHGTQEKYQIFDTLGGRFNSEFGMEAFPHIDTIRYYCTDGDQLYPQSHMLDFHNKADGHERRIATYLVENFRTRTELEPFIHLTQLSQSEALTFGYRGWRRQWGIASPDSSSPLRHCGGALVWQLNDCWPVTSWSIVDYFQRKKPAYYALRRVLAPIAIAIKRTHFNWSVVHARVPERSDWECWIAWNGQSQGSKTEVIADVEIRFVSIQSGKDVKPAITMRDIKLVPNGTTEIMQGSLDNWNEQPHVLAARVWVRGKLMGRDTDWPQPLKYLDFADRGVKVDWENSMGSVRVAADKPVKGFVFEEREGVLLSDSAMDIVPGDEQAVTVRGLKEGDAVLKSRFLGME